MRHRFPFLVVVLVLSSPGIAPTPASADSGTEDLWLISTRGLATCRSGEEVLGDLDVRRRTAEGEWDDAELSELVEGSDPAVPTCFYIHGNRTDRCDAIQGGLRIARLLRQEGEGRPFRLVIWSWPSDRVPGPKRDARVKAARSDTQSKYLAQVLRRWEAKRPVCLIGYSFGSRVVTGAMQLVGGGTVAGRSLVDAAGSDELVPPRLVLIAAALDADWLLPGRRNGLALEQVDRVLVTRNDLDRVLRWYPLMYRVHGPKALGAIGPTCRSRLPIGEDRLDLLRVTSVVGREHDLASYLRSGSLRRHIGEYVFGLAMPEGELAAVEPGVQSP